MTDRVIARNIVRHRVRKAFMVSLSTLGRGFVCLILLLGAVSYTRAYMPTRVSAATADTLNFQARIYSSSGNIVTDGDYSVEFRIYNSVSGGTSVWSETQTLQLKGGYFSAELASVMPFGSSIDWSQEKWLTMNINGDGEMNPRLKLTATPYSLLSEQANTLSDGSGGTLDSDDLAQLAPSSVQAVNSALAALRINQTGTGLLAQLQGDSNDVFTVAKNGDVSSAGDATFAGGNVNIGSASQSGGLVLFDGSNNTATIQTASLNSNRTYTLPDVSGEICLDSGNCGGGGDISQGGNGFGEDIIIGTNDAFALGFETNGVSRLSVDTGGNVDVLTGGIEIAGTNVISSNRELQNIAGLTVVSDGANITGGINNNSGGIAQAGSISGVTGITFTSGSLDLASGGIINAGSITGATTILSSGNINTTGGALQTNGVSRILSSGALQNVTGNNVDGVSFDANTITSGILSAARGGTGVDGSIAADGQLLIGNGSGYVLSTLTSGSGVSIVNNPGAIAIAAILGDSISTAEIENEAVTTEKIADGSVTNNKLANSSVSINSGTGLAGGGVVSLGDSVTLNLDDTAVVAGSYGSSGAVTTFTVDAQGRLTAAGTTTLANSALQNSSIGLNYQSTNLSGDSSVALGETLNIDFSDNPEFDSVTATGAITAAATGNTINGLVINSGSVSGVTGFNQSSGNFIQSGTGTFTTGSGTNTLNGITNLTGNTTVTGVNNFTVGAGLTTLGGGANITGGINNNSGGITNVGSITGATTISSSGNINTTGGALQTNSVTRLTNAGALSNITGFSQTSGTHSITGTGAITIGGGSNALTINSTNFDVSSSGAVSGISTISASGAITAASSTNTINGLVINGGALSSVTGITFASGSLNLNSGGIVNTGSIAGATTINASGLITSQGLTAGSGLIQTTGGLTVTGPIALNTTGSAAVDIGNVTTPLTINSSGLTVASDGSIITKGTITSYNDGYNLFSGASGLDAYGYFRAVNTSDTAGRFEVGAYDISGASQGGRDLVLNPLGGNVGIGGDTTPDGLLSVGLTSQFQVNASGAIAATTGMTSSGLVTISGGGANITGGVDNNSGGITEAGAISGIAGMTFTSGSLNLNGGGIVNTGSIAGATTISASGAITAASSTNTINGLVINSGALSSVTGFSQTSGAHSITGTGAITIGGGSNALTINSTNFDVSSAGVLSGITTINMSGSISAATSSNTINGLVINSGSLSGVTGYSQASGNFSMTGSGTFGTGSGIVSLNGNTSVTGSRTFSVGTGLTSLGGGLSVVGNSTLAGNINFTSAGGTISTASTELVMEQNGDTFGTTRLRLQNRNGMNGALFENVGLDLVDFGFKPSVGPQANLRFEHRSGSLINSGNTSGEFQFLDDATGSASYTLAFGTAATTINQGNLNIRAGSLQMNGVTFISNARAISNITGFSQTSGAHSITGTGAITIGGGSNALTINSTNFDVSSAGAVSGVTSLTASGTVQGSTVNATSVFQINGTSGSSINCGSNNYLSNIQLSGGIITGNNGCRGIGLSDARLKTNVTQIDSSVVDKIKNINLVNFDFDCSNEIFVPAGGNMTCDETRQAGVMAQELAEIFPELVYQEEDGYYRVKYDALNIYTLKATSEIAKTVDGQGNVTSKSLSTGGTIRLNETGQLDNITGLRLVGGGANIVGGIDNNGGGITSAGEIEGITNLTAQSVKIKGNGFDNFLELTKDEQGVFTVFESGALRLQLTSNEAFIVKDQSGSDFFSVNTEGGLVRIGSEENTAGVLLVLDNVELDGDPVGINGAQYYNSNLQRFRCFENNVWKNCVSSLDSEYVIAPRAFTWRLPFTDTEIPTGQQTWVDLTNAQSYRIVANVDAAGISSSKCRVQFNSDPENRYWSDISKEANQGFVQVNTAGSQKSSWASLAAGANQEVLLRVLCQGGDGTQTGGTEVEIDSIRIQVR